MKLAICVKNKTYNSEIDNVFGRTEYFCIIDLNTNEMKFLKNTAKDEQGGAGGKAVRLLYQNKVNVVIVSELGPKAIDALKKFEIKAFKKGTGESIDVLINDFNNKNLEEIVFSTIEGQTELRRV